MKLIKVPNINYVCPQLYKVAFHSLWMRSTYTSTKSAPVLSFERILLLFHSCFLLLFCCTFLRTTTVEVARWDSVGRIKKRSTQFTRARQWSRIGTISLIGNVVTAFLCGVWAFCCEYGVGDTAAVCFTIPSVERVH